MNYTLSEFLLLRKPDPDSLGREPGSWTVMEQLNRKRRRSCDFIQVWRIGGNGSGTTNMAPDPIQNNLDNFMLAWWGSDRGSAVELSSCS